jgi:hypothetical protein
LLNALFIFAYPLNVFSRQVRILLDFKTDGFASLMDEVTMMRPLDESFKAESNEQTDGDGGKVDEKVMPTVNSAMGRVYVQDAPRRDTIRRRL